MAYRHEAKMVVKIQSKIMNAGIHTDIKKDNKVLNKRLTKLVPPSSFSICMALL